MQFDVTAGHVRLRFRRTIVTLFVLTSSHEGEVERTTLVEPT
jgi:hypothetical protein